MWNDFEPKKVAIEIARKENSISSVSEFILVAKYVCGNWKTIYHLHVQFGFNINFWHKYSDVYNIDIIILFMFRFTGQFFT